jgi:nucleoside-diphosphate-sugar epimerase
MKMTIALAGGTSSIGRSIVDGLLEQGRNDFIIFSRTTHPTLQTHTVDYTDVDKLVHELEQLRIEVVISALSIDNQSSGRAQLNLIDAARRSRCVRRFIPSEYGGIDYSPDPEYFPVSL